MLENVKKKINKDYLQTEISNVDDGDLDMVMKNKKAIDKKLKGSGMKKYAELGKLMFGMLQDYRKGEYTSPPWFTIAAIGLTLLYVFNPMDMLPDFLPGVGYVDDFALFTVAIRFIESDLHAYLDWKIDEAKMLNS
ncbi:YkvA family protein [Salinimicrobium sp. CAU 1759]